jgi:uncharacterized protein
MKTFLPFLLAFSGSVHAAGFDCAKAASKTEKTVCADAALSKLDDQLSRAYRQALQRGDEPKPLKTEQAAWLHDTRDACKTRDCLRGAYEARIATLDAGRAVYPDLSGAIVQTCAVLARIAGTDATHCQVKESAQFGKLGEETQTYAIYCLEGCDTAAIALFSVEPKREHAERWWQHVDSEGEGDEFAKPQLIQSGRDLLLHVPVSIPGTGAFNASALFRHEGEHWTALDTTSWQKDLAAKLPKGLAVWKGIWPDWRHMSAETGLYRSKDANCCATGGTAIIKLRVDGNRIALDSFSIAPVRR